MAARRVVQTGHKWCPACQQELEVSAFPKNRANGDGLAAYCKPRHNAKGQETRKRLYGGSREYHLRARYGITTAEVDLMIAAQGGTCAVCPGKPEHVDHDHKTDKVRGILCFNCNQALGNVRDNPEVLRELARCLGRHGFECRGFVIQEFEAPTDIVFELGDARFHAA